MATLPLQDIAASVAEMRRAVIELGHVGVTVPPNVAGRNLDDPAFHPLFAEAERLDIPVSIHWGNGAYLTAAGTERFDSHFMVHAIGHPFEQMIALASIVCGGVLELFPTLRFGFLEAGCGWLPYWAERLHEHYERRAGEVPLMRSDPLEYLAGGRCYVTAEPDERGLPAALDIVGTGNIMFASDYPHSDSKFPDAVACLRRRSDLSDQAKEKILGANAATYYHFDHAAGQRVQ
jgi:predicted TIM-barrel fold metal-dependent hydrolase